MSASITATTLAYYDLHLSAPQEMPSAFDAKGRPLWFDGLRGETSLQNLVWGTFAREQFGDLDRLLMIGTIPLTGRPTAIWTPRYSKMP